MADRSSLPVEHVNTCTHVCRWCYCVSKSTQARALPAAFHYESTHLAIEPTHCVELRCRGHSCRGQSRRQVYALQCLQVVNGHPVLYSQSCMLVHCDEPSDLRHYRTNGRSFLALLLLLASGAVVWRCCRFLHCRGILGEIGSLQRWFFSNFSRYSGERTVYRGPMTTYSQLLEAGLPYGVPNSLDLRLFCSHLLHDRS